MHAMAVGGSAYIVLVAVLLFLLDSVSGQNIITQYPSVANLSSSWSNSPSSNISVWESAGVEAIFVTGSFVCGFHCMQVGSSCLFAISIFQRASNNTLYPRMVWSANRKNPVRFGAKMQLTGEGDLVLHHLNGTQAWSTNTSGNSVAGMKLTEDGNLVLFDRNNSVVWQSFNHPTNSLLVGQRLVSGQKLVASVSTSDWGEGLYSLALDKDTLNAYFEPETNRPRLYLSRPDFGIPISMSMEGIYYCQYVRGSFSGFGFDGFGGFRFPQTYSAQFLKLDSDGHLKIYSWGRSDNWEVRYDLLTGYILYNYGIGECVYTGGCGEYGICLNDTCSCPASNQSDYFKQKDVSQPYLGCYATTPISCDSYSLHSLLAADSTGLQSGAYTLMQNATEENCKQACLNKCSCGAVSIYTDSSKSCRLFSSPLFNSSDNGNPGYSSIASTFVKVQNPPPTQGPSPSFDTPLGKKRRNVRVLLESILGATFVVFLTIGACLFFLRYKKASEQIEEKASDQAWGIPARFSYEDLKVMTKNFSTKLGEGGFGSVFLGTLPDGTTEIAVKQLDGFGHVKKSFLAEVQTIGSVDHVNLVNLVGFCSEKSHRLLVYEYMCSGSLDRWIFNRTQALHLSWQCRRRIIRDIAKGLAYLHEDCSQKILHLDIKPQNILLDENFNAKVSDFGLAKLISKEETKVVTAMRGTPGYMAPEWLSSAITEKVDVYSFGVVVLEILCGRKNLDRSQPEEDMHLLSVFERKAKEDSVLDMVEGKLLEEMDQTRRSDVLELMKVAAWCLQSDFSKRPSMHLVIKVLEGSVAVEENLEYDFSIGPLSRTTTTIDCIIDPSTILPSKLSGPR